MLEQLKQYFGTLAYAAARCRGHGRASRRKLLWKMGCAWLRKAAHETHDAGNKIIFVGNGGSAGIASHLAIDFSKNGGLRAHGLQRSVRSDLPRQRPRLRERLRQADRFPCAAWRFVDRASAVRGIRPISSPP